MNLANFLTILRLALAPAIVWLIVARSAMPAAILFAIAAATDAMDGWAARTQKQITKFGQFADPVADKVLLSGTFLAFGMTGAAPFWLVMVVFGRDLYLILATWIAMKYTRLGEYRPTWMGKLNTAIQILYVVLLLASEALANVKLHNLGELLIWPIAALAVLTGVHYTVRGIGVLSRD